MATSPEKKANSRVVAAVTGLIVGVAFIALCSAIFRELDDYGIFLEILFGGSGEAGASEFVLPYPFSIQNVMWLMFFVGFGEIWTRWRQTDRDMAPMGDSLLPEDAESMLRSGDLGSIYRKVQEASYAEDSFLPRLIRRTILQFQSSRSVDQANSLLNSTLELCQHEIDLRYNMLRYLVWLIPTLGFIGTVIGIATALWTIEGANFDDPTSMGKMMGEMTTALGVAFYTTLLALMQSAVLVFAVHVTQAREERVLNHAGQYCLDNLINRLYDK